ncbi:DUF4198 domain-containing protein [Acinetobacter sp. ANC 3813]|uniref:DUF4198 domain-containing protein n=1 Tax=Acinetobacter sp. ANC 3813 TaxID=1977873 RepID=UPI000A352D40|nr:DUF4198 domain-containing protein [Acinetobacter sp. ANC 3813]OTG91017.1 hypothetical protein B9T34_06550 [Acinetobacter sp. ANC 3813]
MNLVRNLSLISSSLVIASAAYAHYPYIAPLSYQTFNNHSAIISGFYDNPFVSEIAIKNFKFHVHTPAGQKIELKDTDWANTQTLSSYSLENKVDGSYRIRGEKPGSMSSFAQVNKEWKALIGGQPAADKPRNPNVVYRSQLAKNAKIKTVQAQEIIETFVSRRTISSATASHLHDGFDVQFITHPNAIQVNQPIQFKVLDNQHGIKGLNAEILVQTTDYSRDTKVFKTVTTDEQGVLNFSLAEKGQYLLKIDYQQPFNHKGNELKRYKYTLSFNVTAK